MSNPYSSQQDGANDTPPSNTAAPQPTVAGFSPNQTTASRTGQRSSVIIHQKSPLLVATPPQVTRALAYSHPIILPLNHLAGLVSWTTGDAWESFLLVCAFWFTVLYGDYVVRWTGPLVVVVVITVGMYSRRYSPLSSTTWSGEKRRRNRADSEGRKSLDEILETLQTFTKRCEVLLDPFLNMTEFLSTQSSATSATTRPALTTLFIRILAFTPVWVLMTFPPFYILTTKRVFLVLGTLSLSWHSRPARVTRTILWRSKAIRRSCSLLTGLHFSDSTTSGAPPPLPKRPTGASIARLKDKSSPGIRFTFTLFENQRRWLGLGWTPSLLAYERQNWTDEHHNATPAPDDFQLPDTDMPTARWRWAPKSSWRIEGATTEKERSAKRVGGGGGGDGSGWVYYDNKWLDGRKTDGWGRYTRRRKWVRDAELVEITQEEVESGTAPSEAGTEDATIVSTPNDRDNDTASLASTTTTQTSARRKTGWFGSGGGEVVGKKGKGGAGDAASLKAGSASSRGTGRSSWERDSPEDDRHTPLHYRQTDWDRSINEGLTPGLS